ncbi:GntR family transcriptional regulator [Clostridium sp. LBM24168]
MSIKNSSLAELAYNYLKKMILNGKIKCGERILEANIATILNISRTPVREAIRRLSSEGIVNVCKNRYSEVITFSKRDIIDLGIMRLTYDTLAVQLAIQNGSNKDFSELLSLATACEKALVMKDHIRQINYDMIFHLKLVEIGGNSLLIDAQHNLQLKTHLLFVDQYVNHQIVPDYVSSFKEHKSIVDALFSRDVEKSISACTNHLTNYYGLSIKTRHITFDFN